MIKSIVQITFALLVSTHALAQDDLDQIKTALNEIHIPEVRAKLPAILIANKDASQKDARRMKLIDRVAEIVQYDLSKKYDATPADYDKKITLKEDRDLFKVILDLNEKQAYRRYLLCKGNLDDAIKAANRSQLLRRNGEALGTNSKEYISVYEQVVNECKYDDYAIWPLLASYRFNIAGNNAYRSSYNKLMLRIISEDQAEYDYSGSPADINDLKVEFKVEFPLFLTNVNGLDDELTLSKQQVLLITEATLAKYRTVFSMSGIRGTDEAFYTVQPMVVLPYWLHHYKLDDLRTRFINTFFTGQLAKDTLETYSRNPNPPKGFKEVLKDLQQAQK